MALDLYAGPLVRYYRDDWETVAQRWSRESGTPLTVIRPNVDPGPPPSVAEVLEALSAWRDFLNRGLADKLKHPIEWQEDPSGEYLTDRPGHDGYAALILWAAYAEEPSLTPPARVPSDYGEDPAFKAVAAEARKSAYGQLLHEVEIWLPVAFPFSCVVPHLGEGEVGVGSVPTMREQLQSLNDHTWRANPADLERWRAAQPDRRGPLEAAAQFGFAVVEHVTRWAAEHRVPMKLDY